MLMLKMEKDSNNEVSKFTSNPYKPEAQPSDRFKHQVSDSVWRKMCMISLMQSSQAHGSVCENTAALFARGSQSEEIS